MPIAVICPGCRAQFRVSDKFAGKEGPCPKCKTIIQVPAAEEIKIHGPEEPAVKTGQSPPGMVPKPAVRKKLSLSPVVLTAALGSALGVAFISWIAGEYFRAFFALAGAGLLAVSIPLCVAGYELLRDEELEAYRGTELWIRAAICGSVYAALWGGFAFLPATLFANNWNWLFLPVPFLAVGWAAAYFSFDLTPENGFFHYAFYLLISIGLRALIGLPALWNLAPPASPGTF